MKETQEESRERVIIYIKQDIRRLQEELEIKEWELNMLKEQRDKK